MKTKKSGIYAAFAAVLLLSAALITNCTEDLFVPGGQTASGENQTPTFVPPPGKGYVMLKFGSDGRTIRPATGDAGYVAAVANFTHFDVIFEANGGGAITDDTVGIGKTYPQVTTTPFTLSADGDYIVKVYAFAVAHSVVSPDTDDFAKAVAYGTGTVTVTAGNGVTSSIALTEIRGGTGGLAGTEGLAGTGTFAWDLTTNSSITTAAYTLTTNPGNTAVTGHTNVSLLGNFASSTALAPGYYNVAIALSGPDVQSVTIREVLHIYQGMTSSYGTSTTPKALPVLSRNVYDVTFTYADGRTPDGRSADGTAASNKVNHGTSLGTTLPANPTHSTDNTQDFEGWYTENTHVNKWLSTTPVIKDIGLFAHWVKGVEVHITWTAPTGTGPAITVHRITYAGEPEVEVEGPDISGDPIEVSQVTPPILRFKAPSSGYTAYSWTVASVPGLISSTNSIDLDFGNPAYIDLLIQGELIVQLQTTGPAESNGAELTVTP